MPSSRSRLLTRDTNADVSRDPTKLRPTRRVDKLLSVYISQPEKHHGGGASCANFDPKSPLAGLDPHAATDLDTLALPGATTSDLEEDKPTNTNFQFGSSPARHDNNPACLSGIRYRCSVGDGGGDPDAAGSDHLRPQTAVGASDDFPHCLEDDGILPKVPLPGVAVNGAAVPGTQAASVPKHERVGGEGGWREGDGQGGSAGDGLRLEPPVLVFEDSPLCVPASEVVVVRNIK